MSLISILLPGISVSIGGGSSPSSPPENLQTFTGTVGGAAPGIYAADGVFYSGSVAYSTFQAAQDGSCLAQRDSCVAAYSLTYACENQRSLCQAVGDPVQAASTTSLETLGLQPFQGGLGGYYAPGITLDVTLNLYTFVNYYATVVTSETLSAAIVGSCASQAIACNNNYGAAYACADQYGACAGATQETIPPATSLDTLGLQTFQGGIGGYFAPGVFLVNGKYETVEYGTGTTNRFLNLGAALSSSCNSQLNACVANVRTDYACSDQFNSCNQGQSAVTLQSGVPDPARCPKDLSSCPIENASSALDYECLDLASELESCGGCRSLGRGQDCTAIPGAKSVGCEQGTCVVYSCGRGSSPSLDKLSCMPSPITGRKISQKRSIPSSRRPKRK